MATKSSIHLFWDRTELPPELAQARPWIRGVARFGFWAMGFIHLVVGILAVQLAAGLGGEAESLRSALDAIHSHSFGSVVLVILALGFLSYAAWRFVQAILNPDGIDRNFIGICLRIGSAFGGMIYLGLGVSALRVVFFGGDGGRQSENQQVESATATLLAQPYGKVLVGIVVLILAGIAAGSFVHAWRARFRDQFAKHRISSRMFLAVTTLGRMGYAARGLVFAAAAWLFIQAALHADASAAGGMSEAMEELLQQPFGRWLLGAAGTGFIAYGLFCWSLIRYRRLPRQGHASN